MRMLGHFLLLCSRCVANIVSALPLIKDGQLQALAVGADKRSPVLPNVPTTIEAGVPNSSYTFWAGIFAPS